MKIDRITFKAGPSNSEVSLVLEPSAITIFVGPNNSGKSLALREIGSWLHGNESEMKVISDISFQYPSSFQDLETWVRSLGVVMKESKNRVEFHQPSITGEPPRTHSVNFDEYLKPRYNSIEGNPKMQRELRQFTTSWATYQLDGSSRFILTQQRPLGDLQLPPSSHLVELFREKEKREALRRMCNTPFPGLHFAIDHTSPNLRIKMGSRPPTEEEETAMGRSAIDYHRDATAINELGEGVRAYTGLGSVFTALDWRFLTIDDPEAYLHPPVSRFLGYELGLQSHSRQAQVFASTHSSHFIYGVLETELELNIVRLTYDFETQTASANALSPAQTKAIFHDPLIRTTGVLDAFFHSAVIVTEGDTDRIFYDEILKRVNRRELIYHDCMFLAAHSRANIARIVTPLRNIGIPIAVIVDFDFMWDGKSEWSELLRSIGIEGNTKESIDNELRALREQCRDEGLDRTTLKKNGIAKMSDELKASAKDFLNAIALHGVFCVPVGELESWFHEFGIEGEKTKWLQNALKRLGGISAERKSQDDQVDPFEFVESIIHWLMTGDFPIVKSLEEPPLKKLYKRVGTHTLSDLRIRIREDERTEFLESIPSGAAGRKRLASTIASFMNTNGGIILIGIGDKGAIIGLEPTQEALGLKGFSEIADYIFDIVQEYIGFEFGPYVSVLSQFAGRRLICEVHVSKTPTMVFVGE
ncbi:MAG: ATP-dependent endonuclease [Candidatus Thorarchaeota archaeon]